MLKILLIGDTHFKVDNALESDDFISKCLDYVDTEKENLDLVVLLGDILDTHEKINLLPFYRATNFIINLSKLVKTFVLIGNHDRLNNAVFLTDEHPFIGLKEHNPNLLIVDEVVEYLDMLFVPYVPKGKFMKALHTVYPPPDPKNPDPDNEFNLGNYSVVFAHQEFIGAKMLDYESQDGDYWSLDNPPVYSGHIHQYQRLRNVIYVGTPFQTSFTDDDNKRLMLLTLDEDIQEERIELPLVKKRQITINVKDVSSYEIDEDYITRLIIEGEDKAIRKVILNKDIAQKLKHPNIRYKIRYIDPKKEKEKKEKEKEKTDFKQLLQEKIDATKNKNLELLYEDLKDQSSSS
jgi:hypothetical protein